MALASSSRIEFFLPNRIGDALLTLPAIATIYALQNALDRHPEQFILYPSPPLSDMVRALNIFKVGHFSQWTKVRSWLKPARESYFLCASKKHFIGLRTGYSVGQHNPLKQSLNYSRQVDFLSLEAVEADLPPELVSGLKVQFGLSIAAIRYFGIALELGYSVAEILDHASGFAETLHLPESFFQPLPQSVQSPYAVFCIEAAYGGKRGQSRCFAPEHYFKLAERLHTSFGMMSVFVGLNKMPALPNLPYLIDRRSTAPFWEVIAWIRHARYFIGNDSGLLHLANFLKTPTFGVYLVTHPDAYGPIFPASHHAVIQPRDEQDLFEAIGPEFSDNVSGIFQADHSL